MDKTAVCKSAVEKYRQLILDAERYIWKHPETGYREVGTSKYMQEQFEALGYELVLAGDIPGFYTVLDTGRPGPEILVMAELDSLINSAHPECDPKTSAVHSCGHHAQCAAMLGLAAALKEPGVLDGLCGRIRLCAVPAEELIEIEYRSELRKQGIIKFYGGKQEFMRRGYFDGVDFGFMVHTRTGGKFVATYGAVGCIAKQVRYKGVSAHAGGSPWNGRNALYAASLGLQAVNSIRETFKEQDYIRVHPIITKGGDAVNAIPADVRIESFIRGRTFEAMQDANKIVNRAFTGTALSLGVNVETIDAPGYAPYTNDPRAVDLAEEALALCCPEEELVRPTTVGTGSTDMGDIAQVMPFVYIHAPGAGGVGHGSDYRIDDPERACVKSALWQLTILQLMLSDDAKRAKEICENYETPFPSIKAYTDYLESVFAEGDRLSYNEDETLAEAKI